MSEHTQDSNFRYSNDNRDFTPGQFDYPSQQEINPSAIKGSRDYYPNDNGGYYANSNREDISTIDPVNKKQPPNSNFKIDESPWTPSVISTKFWYDASDLSTITSSSNVISQVDDKSGNNIHLNVITDGKIGPKTGVASLNGLNVFYWDTPDQILENNSFFHDQANTALFVAMIFKADIDSAQDFLLAGTESGAAGRRMSIRRVHNTDRIQIIGGSNTGSNIILSSDTNTAPEGQDFILLTKMNSTSSTIRLNGELEKIGNIGTNPLDSLNIGGNANESSNIKGYIAEIISFEDANQQTIVEGYLAHKWALQTKLPTSHPYKNSEPVI